MIKQLSLQAWDEILCDAETAPYTIGAESSTIKELSKHIRTLSDEIYRMRLTYGEPCLHGVNTTKEEDQKERLRYQKS